MTQDNSILVMRENNEQNAIIEHAFFPFETDANPSAFAVRRGRKHTRS